MCTDWRLSAPTGRARLRLEARARQRVQHFGPRLGSPVMEGERQQTFFLQRCVAAGEHPPQPRSVSRRGSPAPVGHHLGSSGRQRRRKCGFLLPQRQSQPNVEKVRQLAVHHVIVVGRIGYYQVDRVRG
ncbi:MAG: hypothetical protein HY320_09115 [Armatimonadetes bacterium]|nr:hypothetical protein [Armatimonadota bacterium]